MTDGGQLQLGERLKSIESEVDKLDRMLTAAYDKAKAVGKVVGRVSRFGEVKVGEGSRIEFIVDPSTYYGETEAPFQRVGDYLIIVDPKDLRLVLVRVTAINRRDELAIMGLQPPVSPIVNAVEPRGLMTDTVIEGELILEKGDSDGAPRPAIKSIEPQAPVVVPSPQTLRELLALPAEGVTLGSLATPGGLIEGGRIPVKLPLQAFLHHVLIIGTTGAGKTTLLKNMIASAYSQQGPGFTAIVVDLNDDFVQLPMGPQREPEPREIYSGVYSGVSPPAGVMVVLPVTAQATMETRASREGQAFNDAMKEIGRDYVADVIAPLLGGDAGGAFKHIVSPETGLSYFEAQDLPFRLDLVPYFIDTTRSGADSLSSLMPGLSELARGALNSIRRRFRAEFGFNPPLEVVQAALLNALAKLRKGAANGDEQAINMALELVGSYVAIYKGELRRKLFGKTVADTKYLTSKRLIGRSDSGGTLEVGLADAIEFTSGTIVQMMPHRSTLEALFRRVSSLLDTGFVDILVETDRGLEVLEEPSWEAIVKEANGARVPVVLDLRKGLEGSQGGPEALRVLAYRMLDRLIAWKHEAWRRRERDSPEVVIFIDEAHQFFPSEGRSKEEVEEVSAISAMISKVARLGRSRGIGLVFSTHSPKDLNSIVIQLANTKVLLRSEESQVEALSLPQEVRHYLPRLQDRYMAVVSYVFREGYVFAATTTPLTMHYDISA
ncbi:MAG: ATP-binding protein [Acidilobus sp.]